MVATMLTGVSGGLGAALFDVLERRGDRLLALGRRFTNAQRMLCSDEPGRVRLRVTDLSTAPVGLPEAAELAEFCDAGDDPHEPAILVHNAGSVQPIGAVGGLDARRLAGTVTVNLTAAMVLTNTFLAAAGTRPVHIVYISSGAARRVIGGWSTYCASKAGAEMFFAAVAEQYADNDRVRVTTVNPGVMDTDMQSVLRAADDVYFPDRDRYVGLHERGELPSPATVATRIVGDHLTS